MFDWCNRAWNSTTDVSTASAALWWDVPRSSAAPAIADAAIPDAADATPADADAGVHHF
jgi:hypothetical protein